MRERERDSLWAIFSAALTLPPLDTTLGIMHSELLALQSIIATKISLAAAVGFDILYSVSELRITVNHDQCNQSHKNVAQESAVILCDVHYLV